MVSVEQANLMRTPGVAQRPFGTAAKSGRLPFPVILFFLALMIPIHFTVGSLYMTGMRLLLLVMIVPLAVMLMSGKFGKIILTDYLLLGHVLWMAVAIGANNPDRMVQNAGSTGVEVLGAYLIGRAYIRNKEQFVSLCKLLGFLVLSLLPFAIYEAQTGRPIIVEMLYKLPGIVSENIVTIEGRMGMERVQGVFSHPIHFGLFCSVAFSLTYVGLKDIYGRAPRVVLSTVVMLTGFLGLSSGAFLAMLMQLILIVWFALFRKNDRKWWILLGITVSSYVIVDLISDRTPIRVFMTYATFSPHNAYWRGIIFEWGIKNIFGDAANNVPGNPLYGLGLNDWMRPHFMHSGTMDNFWLLMGVRYGLPGLGFLAAGYLYVLLKAIFRDFKNDEQMLSLRRAWVFTFVGLSFTLCTVHIWNSIYSFVFFMLGTGVWFLSASPASADSAEAEANAPPPSRRMVYSRFAAKAKRQS